MINCEDCRCWKEQKGEKYKAVNGQKIGECHRHAPAPHGHWGSKDFTDYTLKVFVRWCLTLAQDGCEEGLPKSAPAKAKR